MMYNLSRGTIEERGWRGAGRIIAQTDSTYTVRVLDLFELVCLKSDKSVTPCLVNDGFWEAWITSWLTKWVRPGMTFIDIGANCGYYTMLAQHLVGQHGQVVAYEPNPVYAELLRASRAINEADFDIREVALSDSCGNVTLSVPGDLHGSASIVTDFEGSQYEANNYSVRSTTLDNELQRLVFWNADVVKIDAEGAEELIWHGGQNIFNSERSHSTLLLEYTPGSYSEEFLNELFEWGYVFHVTFDGGEEPATPASIAAGGNDWQMLVIRRK